MQTIQNDIGALAITRNGANVSVYDMASDAYFAKGRYLDGSGLIENKRETSADFTKRKEITPYRNYYRPCVDSLWEASFREDIKRDFDNSDLILDAYLQDVDAKGSNMTEFMQSVALSNANFGMTLIITDNFETISEAELVNVRERTFPYSYIVRIDRVKYIFLNDLGLMQAICYSEQVELEDGSKETYYRIWTNEATFLIDSVPVNYSEVLNASPIANSFKENTLGVIPAVISYSYPNGQQTFIPSKFIGALLLNDMIYQQGSEVREYQRKLTFPILIAQDLKAEMVDGKPTYYLGSDKIMQIGSDAKNMPVWLQPAIEGLNSLREDMSEAISELEAISGKGEADALSKSSSGETRRVFWQITSQDKMQFASQLEKTEREIIHLFSLWTKQDKYFYTFEINYSKNLGIRDVKAILEEYQGYLDLFEGSESVKKEILKRLLLEAFPKYSSEEIEDLKDMIDAEYEINQETFGANAE